jgi:large subunit ribosomal protein L10
MAAELEQRFPKGTDYVVVGYAKLTGPETTEFRKTLRSSKIRMEVVKNSVAARALETGGIGAGAKFLEGPCALVAGEVSMPAMCKVLVEQSKKLENRISIRGGVMDGAAVNPAGIAQLASIPPLPVLHAQMAGSLSAPIVRLAGAFQSITRSLACALEGIRKQKEGMSPPPGPQAAASGPVPGAAAA